MCEEPQVLWDHEVCKVCVEMVARLGKWVSKAFLEFLAALDQWVSKVPLVLLELLAQLVCAVSKEKLVQVVCVAPQELQVQQVRLVFVEKMGHRVSKASKAPQESRATLDLKASRVILVPSDLLDHLVLLDSLERMARMGKLVP